MALARSFIKPGVFALAACAAIAALIAFADIAGAQQRDKQRQQQRAPNGWQVCNETSYVLEAATGRPDGRAILVQGWTRLRPGECRIAVTAPLARGTHYLYARSSSAHRGGRRQWTGDARICVDTGRTFTIENPPHCAANGFEERRFRRVQINKRDSWRTSFSEATAFTQSRARQQGLQRLLEDAGYEVREGRRGVDPRRVAQAIAQFRATARLAPGASEDQLIDALENAARRRGTQVGLTLCNRTRGRIWTGVARRRGDGWESRGWWPLAAGACVRTIDETLMQEVYYVYASLENEEGPRYLAAGGEPFCTSPARFAVLGRDNCAERFYDTSYFTPISARDRDGLVVEFEDRDFMEAGQPPRQLQAASGDAERPRAAPSRGAPPQAAPAAQTQDRPRATP